MNAFFPTLIPNALLFSLFFIALTIEVIKQARSIPEVIAQPCCPGRTPQLKPTMIIWVAWDLT